MHVLSVSSLKGGVGKTTVTLGLASAAFSRGLRVLVVDLDPQADVSTGMQVEIAGHGSVADVLASPKEQAVRRAIAASGWTREHPGTVDVLIGSPAAAGFDTPHPTVRDIWKLEEALAAVETDYDLVLIDTAPTLNALTRTAWVASDRVALVTEPALFSVAAADRALRAIEEIRRGLSPRLQPLGLVVNRYREQSTEHRYRLEEMAEMFGPLVLSPALPERTTLQQAQGSATPVHLWPGDTAVETAGLFDALLDQIVAAAQTGANPIAPEARTDDAEAAPSAEPAGSPEPADVAPEPAGGADAVEAGTEPDADEPEPERVADEPVTESERVADEPDAATTGATAPGDERTSRRKAKRAKAKKSEKAKKSKKSD